MANADTATAVAGAALNQYINDINTHGVTSREAGASGAVLKAAAEVAETTGATPGDIRRAAGRPA